MSNLVSAQCVDFVKSFEGFSAKPYLDCVGVKTLGYGMTGPEIEKLSSVTEKQAAEMLRNLLNNKYAQPLKNSLDGKGVKLTQNQFDSLVSMAYNVGISGVLGSTLYRNVCAGIRDVGTITENFCAWGYAGGKVVPGLLRRRQAEAAMFFGHDHHLEGEDVLDVAILKNSSEDEWAAKDIDARLGGVANFTRQGANKVIPKDAMSAKKLIVIGGGTTGHPNEVLLSGKSKYDTAQAVAEYLG